MGSLVTAMASYCEAKTRDGHWLLRIDDIDPPREQPGAATLIEETLEQHGFQWDGPVVYQSLRHANYQQAFDTLNNEQQLYGCACTRKTLANTHVYPGHCRDAGLPLDGNACRCRCIPNNKNTHPSADGLNVTEQPISHRLGDVIVRRRDGLFSYTLATVVDDITDCITHVVRGMDLYTVEAAQTQLFYQLDATPPEWLYTEIVTNDRQQKLSKQNLAPALDNTRTLSNLTAAWRLLKQSGMTSVHSVDAFWQQALTLWSPARGLSTSPKTH